MRKICSHSSVCLLLISVLLSNTPALADDNPVTLDESKLFSAPSEGVQKLDQTINLKKGQDKLRLTLTYYDGTETTPSFKWLRVSSPTMNYLTEQQFAGAKTLSIDVSGELSWGGSQLMIQAAGPKGATFGWRLTTPQPKITSVYPESAGAGETVTLTGINFCPDTSGNTVTIAGESATVVDANRKRLVVRLPEGLQSGVAVGHLQVAGIDAGNFKVALDAVPVVTGLQGTYAGGPGSSATYQRPAQPFTIIGRNLPASAAALRVQIGPFDARILRATTDSIQVVAPGGFAGNPWGMNQPIKVWANGERVQGNLRVSIYQPLGED
ncbi:MAG TPA: IPT/TIG domain-containing protein [Oculatellaceae cyanobacterium]